jgi:hypothetical protein
MSPQILMISAPAHLKQKLHELRWKFFEKVQQKTIGLDELGKLVLDIGHYGQICD